LFPQKLYFAMHKIPAMAILTGGLSQRFGINKLDLNLNGNSLLRHALNIAKDIAGDVFLIGTNHNIANDENVRVLPDMVQQCGPIGGIYTALANIQTSAIAVMPGDMPFLNREIFAYLANYFTGTVPVFARSVSGIEPLVSIWPNHCHDVLRRQIEQGIFKMSVGLERCNAIAIDMTAFSQDVFHNVNYLTDLKRLTALNDNADAS
jgi:molybdopterin-guanine dinucleotide biosynthesis protein A